MHRRSAPPVFALGAALSLVVGGISQGCSGRATEDESGTDAAPADGGDDAEGGPAECEARQPLLEFVYANKSCASPSDCVVAQTCLKDSDGCGKVTFGFYLGSSYDQGKWAGLNQAVQSCGPPTCFLPGCDWVPPPTCWHGSCWPEGPEPLSSREECIELLARDTLCAACYCVHNADGACVTDPGCLQLLQCAHDEACLGSSNCAPDNLQSPCKPVVESVGGPGSPAAVIFGAFNAQLGVNGCDVACSKP